LSMSRGRGRRRCEIHGVSSASPTRSTYGTQLGWTQRSGDIGGPTGVQATAAASATLNSLTEARQSSTGAGMAWRVRRRAQVLGACVDLYHRLSPPRSELAFTVNHRGSERRSTHPVLKKAASALTGQVTPTHLTTVTELLSPSRARRSRGVADGRARAVDNTGSLTRNEPAGRAAAVSVSDPFLASRGAPGTRSRGGQSRATACLADRATSRPATSTNKKTRPQASPAPRPLTGAAARRVIVEHQPEAGRSGRARLSSRIVNAMGEFRPITPAVETTPAGRNAVDSATVLPEPAHRLTDDDRPLQQQFPDQRTYQTRVRDKRNAPSGVQLRQLITAGQRDRARLCARSKPMQPAGSAVDVDLPNPGRYSGSIAGSQKACLAGVRLPRRATCAPATDGGRLNRIDGDDPYSDSRFPQ